MSLTMPRSDPTPGKRVTVVGIREVSLSMSVDLEVSPYSDYMYPEALILIGRMQIYSHLWGIPPFCRSYLVNIGPGRFRPCFPERTVWSRLVVSGHSLNAMGATGMQPDIEILNASKASTGNRIQYSSSHTVVQTPP
jgi:hypothetical protein